VSEFLHGVDTRRVQATCVLIYGDSETILLFDPHQLFRII